MKEPEKFLRKLLGASINGVYIYDMRLGRNVYVNDRYTRITGYKLEEITAMTGERFFELFHPEDRPRVSEHFERIARGRVPPEIEYRFMTKNGEWIWCISRDRVFDRFEDGSVRQFIGSFIDITSLKRAEDKLRHGREHLDWVLAQTGIGKWLNELPFGRLNWDALTKRLFFVSPEEEPSIDLFWSRLHKDDREPTRQALEKALRERTVYSINHRSVNPATEEIRWIRSIGKASFSEDGTPARFDGINFDITQQKKTEEALRQSESNFRRLADAMPQLVWTANPSGRVDYCNERQKEYKGIERKPDGTYDWTPLLHEEDMARTAEAWKDAVLTGDKYQVEHRIQLESGEFRWHLSRAIPVRDNKGAIIKWFGTATDIEDVKRTEEALHSLAESLERQVAERTRLAEARAMKLRELAVDLIEAEERERKRISDLLHEDLQQIMASARMQLRSVSEMSDLENIGQLLDKCIEISRGLSRELNPVILDHLGLAAALESLALQMRDQFGLEVDLSVDIDCGLKAEPLNLFVYRAAQELLYNVVKHAEAKSALVEVSGDDNQIRLAVTDQGLGFEPDTRLAAADKAGLGLIGIQERARYIGGDLTIESQPGGGTRVTLDLPAESRDAKDTDEVQMRNHRKALYVEKEDFGPSKAIRVLFADDHQVMRRGLMQLVDGQPDIEAAGEASDGSEAVEKVLRLKPDVVLMDVSMPKMDGIEATRRIKAELPGVRVIGLSMFENDDIVRKMRDSGAETFVSKTASPAELLKAIYGLEDFVQ